MISFEEEGYTLEPCDDMDYFLARMKETVLYSVDEYERSLAPLWLPEIALIIRNNLINESYGDKFILRHGIDYAGALWVGKTKDQFTCEDIGYILGIYIEEEYRGHGLSRKLIRSAEEWCKEKGLVHLSLNVSTVNDRALELYKTEGFEPQSMVMRKLLRP